MNTVTTTLENEELLELQRIAVGEDGSVSDIISLAVQEYLNKKVPYAIMSIKSARRKTLTSGSTEMLDIRERLNNALTLLGVDNG